MSKRNRYQGFTLIEVLVALTIFAILSMTALATVSELSKNYQKIQEQNQHLSEINLTYETLYRDFQQLHAHPFQIDHTTWEPALTLAPSTVIQHDEIEITPLIDC